MYKETEQSRGTRETGKPILCRRMESQGKNCSERRQPKTPTSERVWTLRHGAENLLLGAHESGEVGGRKELWSRVKTAWESYPEP